MRDFVVDTDCGCVVTYPAAAGFRSSSYSPCKRHRECNPQAARERLQILAMAKIHRDQTHPEATAVVTQ